MQLRYSTLSPYARKVLVLAHELGVADQIELVPTQLRVDDPGFFQANPLAKIPTLTVGEHSYFDSRVICEYLDARHGGGSMLPTHGDQRWAAMTLLALADGIVDAGLLARQESLRAEGLRDPAVPELQMAKVARGLDRFESIVAQGRMDGRFDMVGIALASALGWLVMRFGVDTILASRPALQAWYRQVAQRPSMMLTDPEAPVPGDMK